MAMCTNKNETLFWPACVRVCEHRYTFILHALFYYDIAVIFSVCIIYLYIYIYIPYMFVYINYYYLYIYFKCFLITRVRARATLLTTNNLHRKLCAGSSLGSLEGNLFSLHFLHAFFSLSFLFLSRSFLSFFRDRETHGSRMQSTFHLEHK